MKKRVFVQDSCSLIRKTLSEIGISILHHRGLPSFGAFLLYIFVLQPKTKILMKNLIQTTALAVLLSTLAGCGLYDTANQRSQLMGNLHEGMTRKEVIATLGKPEFRRFNNGIEQWEYHKTHWGGEKTVITLDFQDDKVIALDSYDGTFPPVTAFPPDRHLSSLPRKPRLPTASTKLVRSPLPASEGETVQRRPLETSAGRSLPVPLYLQRSSRAVETIQLRRRTPGSAGDSATSHIRLSEQRQHHRQHDIHLGREESKRNIGPKVSASTLFDR